MLRGQREFHIDIPYSLVEERLLRLDAWVNLEEFDRVPVISGLAPRYWLKRIGLSHMDFWSTPENMLWGEVMGYKWMLENIPDDHCEPIFGVTFGNVYEASGLGCEVIFKEGFPWVKEPIIHGPRDLEKLEDIRMWEYGCTGKFIPYYKEMEKLAADVELVYSDNVSKELVVSKPIPGSEGPITNAGWLMGSHRLFTYMVRDPDFVHSLLEIITEKVIELYRYLSVELESSTSYIGFRDDLAAYLSPKLYRKFALPYHLEYFEKLHVKRRRLHMCGKIDHLIPLLVEEENIEMLPGFGYQTSVELLEKYMAGKVILAGGPNPMLFELCENERIEAYSRYYIKHLAPYGGYLLQDGFNIPPASDPASISHMSRIAYTYGRYPQKRIE